MRRLDASSRPAGLSATATTLLALVAVAAGLPALQAPAAHRVAHATMAGALSESEAVRVMTAVVAAAARDLLAPSPITAAVIPSREVAAVRAADGRVTTPHPVDAPPRWRHVDLRRLDLPPPTC